MESAVLFGQYNAEQKALTEVVLKDFAQAFSDGTDLDNILEVGCGVGDITKDILLPCFNKWKRIVGIDISEEAIKFAREHHRDDKIVYEVLDIAGDIKSFAEKWGSFSHVLSILCLHWVSDFNKSVSNISQLLSKNGVCLLFFLTKYDVHEAMLVMSKSKKWHHYMKDVANFLVTTHDTWDPYKECPNLVSQYGMVLLKCEEIDHETCIDGIEYLKGFLRSVDPFVSRIPKGEQELYFQELINQLTKIPTFERKVNGQTKYVIRTKRTVVWARKARNVTK